MIEHISPFRNCFRLHILSFLFIHSLRFKPRTMNHNTQYEFFECFSKLPLFNRHCKFKIVPLNTSNSHSHTRWHFHLFYFLCSSDRILILSELEMKTISCVLKKQGRVLFKPFFKFRCVYSAVDRWKWTEVTRSSQPQ